MQADSDVTAAVQVEALIDRLVEYLQFVLAGEHDCQVVTDLLRTPVLPQAFLNDSGKLPIIELAEFGSARSDLTPFLCGIGSIVVCYRVCVPHAAPDGSWTPLTRRTTQIPRDRPDTSTTHLRFAIGRRSS